MLDIFPCTSAERTMEYFEKEYSREGYNYLTEKDIIKGQWHGKLANHLELAGEVGEKEFGQMINNRRPDTGKRLTQKDVPNRRCAYEFTFNAVKSVSLLYAFSESDQIIKAFQSAVHDTMLLMEQDMKCRIRKGGVLEGDRDTGNFAYASFTHTMSRPAKKDVLPDPHLHIHNIVINATLDHEEQQIKAGQFGYIKKSGEYYHRVFQARLARNVQDMGFGVVKTKDAWEIAGIPQSMIDTFSKRTNDINKKAKDLDLSVKEKANLGRKNRQKKLQPQSFADMQQYWKSQLSDEEKNILINLRQHMQEKQQEKPAPMQSLNYALDHCLERQSVITERKMLTEALKYGVGGVVLEELQKHQPQDMLSVRMGDETVVSRRDVLAEEKKLLKNVKEGKGTFQPINEGYDLDQGFLNEQQYGAVQFALNSTDFVTSIQGRAGTGKTTVQKFIKAGAEQVGKRVIALAPTTQAANVLKEEGFAEAYTVQRLLVDKKLQASICKQIILVDEAALVDIQSFSQLVDIAKRGEARLLLSGDTKQLPPVNRGTPLNLLERNGVVQSYRLEQILRQKDIYKHAVTATGGGDIETGFELFEKMGAVKEVKSKDILKEVATAFTDHLKNGDSALLVVPLHEQGRKLTACIRETMKTEKLLSENEQEYIIGTNKNYTNAQKSDWRNYTENNLWVQFHQNTKGGIPKGAKYKISKAEQGRVFCVSDLGEHYELPIDSPKGFSVLGSEILPVSPGDYIRCTANGYSADGLHRMNNGASYRVKGFSENGNIILHNGWEMDKNHLNFTHNYYHTGYRGQGSTVDHAIVLGDKHSVKALSKECWYVAVSRARKDLSIYTDDKKALQETIQKTSVKPSATEVPFQPLRESCQIIQLSERFKRYQRNELEKKARKGKKLNKEQQQELKNFRHELFQQYQKTRDGR